MIDFFGEAIFILGSQFNKVNLFFVNVFKSGSKGLNSVKNEDTLKSILTLGCRTVSLEILANHKIIYSPCVVYNLSQSNIADICYS